MEGKKISFGFTKTKKSEKPVLSERREYIECLEEKAIKVVGGEIVEEKAPLVITMKPNTLITAERLKQIAEEVEKAVDELPAPGDTGNKGDKSSDDAALPQEESLDQMAERELLNEAKKEKKVDGPALTVAVPSQPVLDGQKESTLEDYEAIPIQEFGMAMLRGMGWTASKEQQLKHKQPELRPKGLGLGADKVIKANQKKNVSRDKDEELSIVKNSFVKITTGKYSGCYGKVVSLDEDNGRVMVDISIKKETVSLSEFMMQAVPKSEFDKNSKVINADSYEEYKKSEQNQKASSNRDTQKSNDREASSSQRSNETRSKKSDDHRSRRDNEYSSNRKNKIQERRHRSRSSSNDDSSRHRRKHEKKRYSSNDSLSSLSDSDRRKKYRSEKKRSEESDSPDEKDRKERRIKSSPDKKRDIDKKRKGKKKKRDRDRSPNYKKHRK